MNTNISGGDAARNELIKIIPTIIPPYIHYTVFSKRLVT